MGESPNLRSVFSHSDHSGWRIIIILHDDGWMDGWVEWISGLSSDVILLDCLSPFSLNLKIEKKIKKLKNKNMKI
jgi:hypothetical protein